MQNTRPNGKLQLPHLELLLKLLKPLCCMLRLYHHKTLV
jgi:hypothetical protein